MAGRATGEELRPDSDTALVMAGFVAVTELVGIRAATGDGSDRAGPGAVDHLERRLLGRTP